MPFDEEELDPHGECRAEIERLRAALRPFAKNIYAVSLAEALGHIGRQDLERARDALKPPR